MFLRFPLAKKAPDLTPISYWRYSQVRGYTYTTKKGRTVRVLPYVRASWVVEFPIPLRELDLTDFGREKFPSRAALTPSPYRPGANWVPVSEFLAGLYEEYDYFSLEDPIYRRDERADLVDLSTGLVWGRPLAKAEQTFSHIGAFGAAVVRAWVLLYDRNKDEFFVFARARSVLRPKEEGRFMPESFSEAYQVAVDIYDGLVEWAETHTDYVEVRQLLAWTFWIMPIAGETEKAHFVKKIVRSSILCSKK